VPDLEYIAWAKALPAVDVNLARSGVAPCPPSALGLTASDLVATLPVKYGYAPLRDAIAARYGTRPDQVFAVSGGATYANWLACLAVLDGCSQGTEIIVERPAYEPLLKIPRALGYRVRRLDRRFEEGYAIDLDRFASLVTTKTRLAIVSNLHNPSGVRIPIARLRAMAAMLARVKAHLLVDEVYLESVFRMAPESCVQAGSNVLTTNSLTKAYGLDGLRAGWILGPPRVVARARRIGDLIMNNSVAAGERMALAAFRRIRVIDERAHAVLDPNLARIRTYLESEQRLRAVIPQGGNVVFPRLPASIDSDRLVRHLVRTASTLVVPGRFFEAARHIRLSFGCSPALLNRGLANLSRALDDLS
jgi:aspartate/methionine/tyrosine aminotransferase